MKKKIKDISNKEMNEICHKQPNCNGCPFERYAIYQDIGKLRVICHKKVRALALLNMAEFKKLYTNEKEGLQKDYYLSQYEEERKLFEEIGEEEIELKNLFN